MKADKKKDDDGRKTEPNRVASPTYALIWVANPSYALGPSLRFIRMKASKAEQKKQTESRQGESKKHVARARLVLLSPARHPYPPPQKGGSLPQENKNSQHGAVRCGAVRCGAVRFGAVRARARARARGCHLPGVEPKGPVLSVRHRNYSATCLLL